MQRQHRLAQYRQQQAYYQRLRRQQMLWNSNYNYDDDPYYYSPAIYRYRYGGRYYQTNRYGAELMRQAVEYGYREGLYAGRADRADGWRYDVRGGYGYLDASYGYDGRYLGYDQYRYYFRQGYERGYADGYYAQDRYARRDGDDLAIAAAVVVAILGLQQLL
ncbi:hypothetical protein GCM10027084_20990 [Pseudoxanthomonas sangjuensis]